MVRSVVIARAAENSSADAFEGFGDGPFSRTSCAPRSAKRTAKRRSALRFVISVGILRRNISAPPPYRQTYGGSDVQTHTSFSAPRHRCIGRRGGHAARKCRSHFRRPPRRDADTFEHER